MRPAAVSSFAAHVGVPLGAAFDDPNPVVVRRLVADMGFWHVYPRPPVVVRLWITRVTWWITHITPPSCLWYTECMRKGTTYTYWELEYQLHRNNEWVGTGRTFRSLKSAQAAVDATHESKRDRYRVSEPRTARSTGDRLVIRL